MVWDNWLAGRCRVRSIGRAAGVLLAVIAVAGPLTAAEPVDFNRDIRPILSEHCWKCHGFDEAARQAGVRLDVRSAAIAAADSDIAPIVPGNSKESGLIQRVVSTDEALRMPPADHSPPLKPREIELLSRWIDEGAAYDTHWSFRPIVRPKVPVVDGAEHPIDAFVIDALEQRGLTMSGPADEAALRRRVSLDLIGLPTTLEDLDRAETESYEQFVDRLLASPHFGEHLAVPWLDAARYADTDGYFGDKPRQIWPWRDYVIDSFNANRGFDQFTIEQLAGDLLPSATIEQRVATGFNRNHMSNDETGLIDEEFRVEYVIDRVNTTASTWLGLTVACSQCHDHKYDPITQKEYYQFFAFFNNVPEKGLLVGKNAPPTLQVPDERLQEKIAAAEAGTRAASERFTALRTPLEASLSDYTNRLVGTLWSPRDEDLVFCESFDDRHPSGLEWRGEPVSQTRGIRGHAAKLDGRQHLHGPALAAFEGAWTVSFWMNADSSLAAPFSCIEPTDDRRGIEVIWQKGRIAVNLVHRWGENQLSVSTRDRVAPKGWRHVVVSCDGTRRAAGVTIAVDGRVVSCETKHDSLTGSLSGGGTLAIGRRDEGLSFAGELDEFQVLSRAMDPMEMAAWFRSERLRGILERAESERNEADKGVILDDLIDQATSDEVRAARSAWKSAQRREQALREQIPLTLVMEELAEPRPAFVLARGQYDQHGEPVKPGFPEALGVEDSATSRNRLDLARWLVSPDHPLTARVLANRLWTQCFGVGLVRTPEDFGSQGEPPTHPELLDYLAADLLENGWDIKRLLRQIVTSRTYRQRSVPADPALAESDPENRWLARGPSYRLSIETIRDSALRASNLLVDNLKGPSVMPYQPDGLWEDVSYDEDESYRQDPGAGLWRRSVYTFVKRQAPPPSLLLFDGPTREKCTLARPRTNTPLQALLVLNDPIYAEAARHAAADAIAHDSADILRGLFRRVLSREPTAEERSAVESLHAQQQRHFDQFHDEALAVLSVGESPATDSAAPSTAAAWAIVAHTLLNLDEALNRR